MKSSLLLSITTISVATVVCLGFTLPQGERANFGRSADRFYGENDAKFQAFVKLFPPHDLPYKLGASELNGWIEQGKQRAASTGKEAAVAAPMAKAVQKATISESFGAFIPSLKAGMFSRMGPDVFRPEAALATTDKNIAVVYSRTRGYSHNYASYYLATYTPKGKRIDELFIGGSKGYKNFTGCTVTKAANGGLLVAVQEYENKWKADGDYYSEDNRITATTLKSAIYKSIAANGTIAAVAVP